MKNKYKFKIKLNLPKDKLQISKLGPILGSKNINIVHFCNLYNSFISSSINKNLLNSVNIYIYKNNNYKLIINFPIVSSIVNIELKFLKLLSKFKWKNYITDKDIDLIINIKYNQQCNFFSYKIYKNIKNTVLTMKILNEF